MRNEPRQYLLENLPCQGEKPSKEGLQSSPERFPNESRKVLHAPPSRFTGACDTPICSPRRKRRSKDEETKPSMSLRDGALPSKQSPPHNETASFLAVTLSVLHENDSGVRLLTTPVGDTSSPTQAFLPRISPTYSIPCS